MQVSFDDEGYYLAMQDLVGEEVNNLSDADYDRILRVYPKFEYMDCETQLSIIGQYKSAKRVNAQKYKKREVQLQGKYVITCIGIRSKKKVYLQDRRISKGGYWTQFKGNALGFDTREAAEREVRKFRYNSPKVEFVP